MNRTFTARTSDLAESRADTGAAGTVRRNRARQLGNALWRAVDHVLAAHERLPYLEYSSHPLFAFWRL